MINGQSLCKPFDNEKPSVCRRSLNRTLTEVIGDVVRNVDLPISPLAPHAASAGAGVGIFSASLPTAMSPPIRMGSLLERTKTHYAYMYRTAT